MWIVTIQVKVIPMLAFPALEQHWISVYADVVLVAVITGQEANIVRVLRAVAVLYYRWFSIEIANRNSWRSYRNSRVETSPPRTNSSTHHKTGLGCRKSLHLDRISQSHRQSRRTPSTPCNPNRPRKMSDPGRWHKIQDPKKVSLLASSLIHFAFSVPPLRLTCSRGEYFSSTFRET